MAKDTATAPLSPPVSHAPESTPAVATAATPVPVAAVRNAGDAGLPKVEPPAAELPTFVVTMPGGKEIPVSATDDRDAWRAACASVKSWPNPKTGKVHRNGKQVYPPVK